MCFVLFLVTKDGKPNTEFIDLCNFEVSERETASESTNSVIACPWDRCTSRLHHLQGGSCQVVAATSSKHTPSQFQAHLKKVSLVLNSSIKLLQ